MKIDNRKKKIQQIIYQIIFLKFLKTLSFKKNLFYKVKKKKKFLNIKQK